jgi:hypothetical protein
MYSIGLSIEMMLTIILIVPHGARPNAFWKPSSVVDAIYKSMTICGGEWVFHPCKGYY